VSILCNEHHIEATFLQHTRELTLADREGDFAVIVIVLDIDGGILALLVIVVSSLVLIQLEFTIFSCIDIKKYNSNK